MSGFDPTLLLGEATPSRCDPGGVGSRDLGAYRILGQLGAGGFGTVHEAVHRMLRRRVALKIFDRRPLDRHAWVAFLREARTAARFEHPHVVAIHDAGVADGLAFLALRLVRGGDLAQEIARLGRLPPRRTLEILHDAAEGLAAIHAAGMVHRDIKPANVLLAEDGTALLSDLGLACFAPLASARTRLSGTPLYLAPELLLDHAVPTPASDLYALGITCFAMLTGETPFASASAGPGEMLAHHQLPDPRRWCGELDPPLLALLQDLTARDPAARPPTAQVVVDRIDLLLGRGSWPYRPPSGREDDLGQAARMIAADPTIRLVLEAMPGPGLVLEGHRQVLAANAAALALVGAADGTHLIGRRPGEILGCAEAQRAPAGCGTGATCHCCGLGRALSEVEQGRLLPIDGTCSVAPADAGSPGWELAWRMYGLQVDGLALRAIAMRDIAPERRRRTLERVLLHEILDAAASVDAVAIQTSGGSDRTLAHASRALVQSITDHERVAAAESGELQALWEPCDLADAVVEAVERWSGHPLAEGRRLAGCNLAHPRITTDRGILATALAPLVRNAIEACPPGGTVTLGASMAISGGMIEIRNPGEIPVAARSRLFRPAEAQATHGIGTWSARLLIEGHLHGRISWRSEHGSTVFRVELPREP